MHKIILDTNVIVSALIKPGTPSQILTELVFTRKVTLYLSTIIFKEYIQVLNRPKFNTIPGFLRNSEIVLNRIDELAIKKEPNGKVSILKDDPDNRFLELAQEISADFLITGNTKDFNMEKYKATQIISPAEYWSRFSNM